MPLRLAPFLLLLCGGPAQAGEFPLPAVDLLAWRPPVYRCLFTSTPPTVDGRLDDPAWRPADWTSDFVDIEGDARPRPPLRTRAKLLWDTENLYVAAALVEPQLWATYTERDAVIYHENDFELFLDPDGDSHDYYELEINALGTVWDLLLTAPYRDGGHAVDAWDIAGLQSAVHLDGTLNDPRDTDRGWSVELALPWQVLEECAPHGGPPLPGEGWRLNFSRVQWDLEASASGYAKRSDPETGRPLPEHNWVWAPQGLIAMHYPELWGRLDFVDERGEPAPPAPAGLHPLRLLYYAQRRQAARSGAFARNLAELPPLPPAVPEWRALPLALAGDGQGFRAWTLADSLGGEGWSIDETGCLRRFAPGARP
ncbi:carbohydrate-binding family 9-like protein [bacterium]|nr:carbohydrate-binding family 9-like protein [bacterium]